MTTDDGFDPGPPPATVLDVVLDDAQVEAFRRDGFTSIERITTDEELEWLAPIYDYLFDNKRGTWKGSYFDLSRTYDADGDDFVPQVLTPRCASPSCCRPMSPGMHAPSRPSCSTSPRPTSSSGAT